MVIRIALDALPAEVLGLIFRQSVVPIAAGLALGIGTALALGRGVEAFLFDVRPTDGLTYAASALLF